MLNIGSCIYPTTESPPKFYGLPKGYKKNTPLRPIVSSVGTITYNCAKLLVEILSPLVGKTVHHVANSQDFAKRIINERVEEDKELRSYDITALFTSVPVDKALTVIQARLEQDNTLGDKTNLSAKQVTKLLKVCLKCTYFVYNGVYYQQIRGDQQIHGITSVTYCLQFVYGGFKAKSHPNCSPPASVVASLCRRYPY